MTGVVPAIPRFKFTDASGNPLASGTVTVYLAGTTTLSNTWQDRGQLTLNTNPINLDANGSALIWLDPALTYKFLAKDSTGATVSGYPVDNIVSHGTDAPTITQITVDRFSGTGAQTAFTLSVTPSNENNTHVYVAGVYQQKNTYSIAGTTLTFAAAPASGTNNIEVNIYDISDYASTAANITASMNAAATSATSAATSASAAAVSAGAAAASATSAASSEAGAAAIVLGNFTQTGAGAVSRTFLAKARDFVSILDFIPVAEHAGILARTSTYDCHDAIISAIESVRTGAAGGFYFSGPQIFFPPGRYRVLSTINITRQVKLIGTTGAVAAHDGGSELSFPAGVEGIITNAFDTNGLVDSGSTFDPDPTYSSAGSVIEGLRLIADVEASGWPVGHSVIGGTGNTDAHGLRMRGMCLLRNLFIFGFEGNGLHMVARDTPGGVGTGTGNVNLFRLEGITIHRCGQNGMFVDGSDSNAGYGLGINVVQNSLCGIYDSSFLGNTWIGCHANTNFAEQYKTDNVNASSSFINCYSEAGGLASSFATGTLVVGGLHGAGINPEARFIQPSGGANGTRIYPNTETGFLSLGIQSTGTGADTPRSTGYTLRYQDTSATTGSTSYWQLDREVGRQVWRKAGVGAGMAYYDAGCTVANGYARNYTDGPMSSVGQIGIGTHFFGGKTEMKYRGLSTIAPTSGEFLTGDVIWKSVTAAAGKIGWVCTTAGTAGSTAVFKEFGAIDA
jgi:hypothetical protein